FELSRWTLGQVPFPLRRIAKDCTPVHMRRTSVWSGRGATQKGPPPSSSESSGPGAGEVLAALRAADDGDGRARVERLRARRCRGERVVHGELGALQRQVRRQVREV